MRRTLTALALAAFALSTASTASANETRDLVKTVAPKVKAKAEELFDRADTNDDGKVSKVEFRKVVAGLPMLKIKPAMIDKLFGALDANRDGFLTKGEIKQLPARIKGMVTKDGAKKLFDSLKGIVVGKIGEAIAKADTNKDGKLSMAEFRGLIVSLKLPKVTPQMVEKLFRVLDRNKDGQLTKDEAQQIAAKIKEIIPSLTKDAVKKVAEKVIGKVAGKAKDALLGKLKDIF